MFSSHTFYILFSADTLNIYFFFHSKVSVEIISNSKVMAEHLGHNHVGRVSPSENSKEICINIDKSILS